MVVVVGIFSRSRNCICIGSVMVVAVVGIVVVAAIIVAVVMIKEFDLIFEID